jgi:hypothetical protein
LGVRWDYFSPTGEKYSAQANFVPGNPFGGAEYIIPSSRQTDPALPASFTQLLTQDGIKLVYSGAYGSGLSNVQKSNFAPRFGFAYQLTPKFVVRGGYGLYYGSFENRGGYPSLGYNFPFQYTQLQNFLCRELQRHSPIPAQSCRFGRSGVCRVSYSPS